MFSTITVPAMKYESYFRSIKDAFIDSQISLDVWMQDTSAIAAVCTKKCTLHLLYYAQKLYNEGDEKMIFGVDFDGTLSFGQWPDTGEPNTGLINFLQERKERGDKLILWTCREGECLNAAVDWCASYGLNFDAVNDNLPEISKKYGCNSRKISCDFYIDDKAVSGNVYKLLEGKK